MNTGLKIFILIFAVSVLVIVLNVALHAPDPVWVEGSSECEFVYEVGQTLYQDMTSFVEKFSVEETLKVVDSEGNETCLYKFDNSDFYFSQEDVLKSYYMTEEK
jgi:hypothetical protein